MKRFSGAIHPRRASARPRRLSARLPPPAVCGDRYLLYHGAAYALHLAGGRRWAPVRGGNDCLPDLVLWSQVAAGPGLPSFVAWVMGRFVAVGWNEQSPESDRRRQKRALSDVRRASQQSGVERHSVMQYSHHHGRGHGSRIRTVSCANQQGHVIDREQMPEGWPTDHIPSEFWKEYGKAVGAFGVLEDTLKRAYLKITGTRGHKFQTEEQTKEAVAAWGRELEKSLNESLGKLIRRITKAIRADDRYPTGAGATLDVVSQGKSLEAQAFCSD